MGDHSSHEHNEHNEKTYFDDSTDILTPIYIVIVLAAIFGLVFLG